MSCLTVQSRLSKVYESSGGQIETFESWGVSGSTLVNCGRAEYQGAEWGGVGLQVLYMGQ